MAHELLVFGAELLVLKAQVPVFAAGTRSPSQVGEHCESPARHMLPLHRRYQEMTLRGVSPQIAVVALARDDSSAKSPASSVTPDSCGRVY
jgi:hypothetical protein